ncbi:hypothetical protein NHX12_008431 [Muraenolepis orangiensis]|uniref:Uncharacterized protein n=1 Tax=Muraenolepis orangiensis TaxID=630683 RepID=A0A9Q0DNU2_9TELE|nr:hypothetical protein NHX12_008431 [Muraenolepis orangiensis]
MEIQGDLAVIPGEGGGKDGPVPVSYHGIAPITGTAWKRQEEIQVCNSGVPFYRRLLLHSKDGRGGRVRVSGVELEGEYFCASVRSPIRGIQADDIAQSTR